MSRAWGLLQTPGEEKARNGDLRGAAIDFIAAYDYVTIVELRDFLRPFMEVEGNASLKLDRNVVVWANMSPRFANFVGSLLNDPAISVRPASWLSYVMDGGALRLPIAKRPPKQGYKEPRWLPVCLRPVSDPDPGPEAAA